MSEKQLDSIKRIGVFGGTFDPPHIGHLAAAEHVRQVHRLDQVVFVPVGRPPHKDGDRLTPARHRYLMTLLATLENPHFTVSRVEIERRGVSYTVDTLRQLRAEFGEEHEYFFLIGYDALNAFHTWKDPEQILQLCRLIALARPGYSLHDVDHHDRMIITEMPQIDVSSREIRQRIAEGASVRYWVHELVLNYIERFGLYREASS